MEPIRSGIIGKNLIGNKKRVRGPNRESISGYSHCNNVVYHSIVKRALMSVSIEYCCFVCYMARPGQIFAVTNQLRL